VESARHSKEIEEFKEAGKPSSTWTPALSHGIKGGGMTEERKPSPRACQSELRTGSVYGHHRSILTARLRLKPSWRVADPLVRHALEMICVKNGARLIQPPNHLDSAIDIAGFTRGALSW